MRLFSIILILLIGAGAAAGALQVAHCRSVEREAEQLTGGNASHGRELMAHYGCVACHAVSGYAGTNPRVGPSLDAFGHRTFVAGSTENTPDHLMQFVRDPRSVSPKTAMPNVGVSPEDARDLAAYLYTLR